MEDFLNAFLFWDKIQTRIRISWYVPIRREKMSIRQ